MQEIARGAMLAFVVRLLGAGIAFAFNVALARMLGTEGTGIYFLALSVVTIASVIGRVGLGNSLLRFTASYASENDWATVKGATSKGILLTVIVSSLLTAGLFLAAPWLSVTVFSNSELLSSLRWMILSILPLSLLMLYAEMLRGLKLILISQALQGLILPLVNIIALYFLATRWSVTGAAAGYLTATLITAMTAYLSWHWVMKAHCSVHGKFAWKTLFASCLPLYGVDVMNRALIPWAPLLLLGFFIGNEEVGLYGVATRTALMISMILLVVNAIAAPKIAELYRQGDMESLNNIIRRTSMIMTVISLPPTLLCVFFSGWVMSLFGAQFSSGATILAILALGQFINVVCGSVGYLLVMSGNETLYRNNTVISAILLGILSVILIPTLGAEGAALSSVSALITLNVMSVFHASKRLNIHVFSWHGKQ